MQHEVKTKTWRGPSAHAVLAGALIGLTLACGATVAGTVEAVHTFKGAHSGGVNPQGALLQASDGNLWGATNNGGEDNDGVIFKVSLDGAYESVAGIPLAMGRNLVGDLVQTDDGTLWAVSSHGGDNDAGSILAVGLDGSVSLVYSFNPSGWGGHPDGGLTKASDGYLYGLIPGAHAKIYRVDPATRVWAIVGTLPNDSGKCQEYQGRLVEGSDGAFYGIYGGQFGCVFRATSRGSAKVIHFFKDGSHGLRGLTAGSDGNLYGITWEFRTRERYCAALFRMTTSGKSTTILHFPCSNGYDFPLFGIAQGADGTLHGSAQHQSKEGDIFYTVWSVSPDGSNYSETRMRQHAGEGMGTMIQASDGAFYATAPGGEFGKGTVVRFTP